MYRKQNKRVDKLLHVLLKVTRDVLFEQLRKETLGKVTSKQRDILSRHKHAKEVDLKDIQKNRLLDWVIPSKERAGVNYFISQNESSLDCTC